MKKLVFIALMFLCLGSCIDNEPNIPIKVIQDSISVDTTEQDSTTLWLF